MTAPFNPAGFSALLMGDETLTIACGDMVLAGGHRIACVITRDTGVRRWAEGQGLAVVVDPRDVTSRADWLLSIANLRLIPDDVLALASKGAINFHDGPLPRYAGLNTPAWAIINGEAQHGVSWHMIEGGVDEGDLLSQRLFDIAPDDTAFTLNSKCYAAGMESFAAVLSQLERDAPERTPQDLSQRSYFRRDDRPEGQGVIDCAKTVQEVTALARGLDFGAYWNPLTSLKVVLGDTVLRVGKVVVTQDSPAQPGIIMAVSDEAITIAAADGGLRLSGLIDLDGHRVSPHALCAVGDRVGDVDTTGLDQSSLLKAEPYWRAQLQAMDPLALPLVGGGDGTAKATQVDAPKTLSLNDRLTAAVLVVLRSAGARTGHLALQMPAASPLVAGWVPFAVAAHADLPVADVRKDVAERLEASQFRGGFARDLMFRDPQIEAGTCPQFAISTDGTAVVGAAVTIALSAETVSLIPDPARLTLDAVDLLATRLAAAFEALAGRAETCGDVWALPSYETALILDRWNATNRDYDRSQTIHGAFEAQVARTPEATALVFEDDALSYVALNSRANALAHVLRAKGVTSDTPVGLCAARGPDLLVGALAILKAGGAYLPLDPAYPADRIAHYIADSKAPVILTQTALAETLPKSDADVILIDGAAGSKTDNPQGGAGPDDLAYLIYTSGSTGLPKGVMVTHGNVGNFFAGMDDRIDVEAGAVWLAVTSLSFDISVLELFWTLARGFKLVLAGDDSRTHLSSGALPVSDRSIDFNLFYWGNDDGVGPEKYRLLLEGAKFADANGFNAVWTPERHFHAFGGPYPNPSVTGAAVAAVTQNLAVRAGSCVAPLHHPARIAEEWAVIDNLTNGRVGLAIASGWQPDDFVLRPENTPPDNKPAMYAAIDQLRKLWAGEAVAFPTKDGTPFAVVTQPRPVSKDLPIWVTTAGNPQTWKEAGEIGANVLTHLLGQSVEEVAQKIGIYHQALRDAGYDPADHRVTVMLHTYLADTRAQAEETAREPMKDYLRSAAGLIKQYAWAFPAFKKPQGATNPFEIDLEGLSPEEMDAILEFAFQRYFNDSGMFGTVDDALARTEQLKRIGVDEIACLIDYGIAPDTVLAGLKPLAEVLYRANAGGRLADDDFSLAAQVVRHGVTHLQCTPSMAGMLVADEGMRAALTQIKHLMVGGEALPGSLAQDLRAATGATLQNMYGPTETTIWSTTHVVTATGDTTVPVGTPIANTRVYVLDAGGDPTPVGVPGELLIGGEGVARGYWMRHEMTADRFIANPFGAGRLYRTGDLVAWTADGTLRFLGRTDHQVKIRGHRIELGEIEARLAELPGVTQSVVIARDDDAGGPQLVGYVVSAAPLDGEAAREKLAAVLPAIMVPAHVVTLDAMPLTPNKKIDRKALPRPERRRAARPAAIAPASETQARIAQVWTGLLGVGDLRGEDNFFALGGHSLLAVQAHREIRQALTADRLSITDIFRFPTLEGLAAHLDKLRGSVTAPAERAGSGDASARADTMSRRRAMRAGRSKTGA